ncbi:MAG: Uma2 family endonuclease [Cyanobacteriota bacterium]|nr:Uma2 family endonuclease [Cyanobacteriota bacterium]
MNALTLTLKSIPLTDEQFFQFCQDNRDLKFERNANGDLIIMTPTGGETSNRNVEIAYQVQAWSRQNNLGIAFDSSGGFRLPNGADRSPDAAWVRRERWDALTSEQQTRFVPLCPDFVIELRSKSDTLAQLRRKMAEYRDNGTHLGLAIDRVSRTVEIYRPAQEVEVLNNPTTIGGEDVLPGFVLTMAPIW